MPPLLPVRKILSAHGRADLGGARGPRINLSGSTIADTASVGDVIGTLSVSGGTGSYVYSFTSNPGTLFSITGSSLKVAAALTAGSDPITIKADNGVGGVITQPFTITVTSSAGQSEPFPIIF